MQEEKRKTTKRFQFWRKSQLGNSDYLKYASKMLEELLRTASLTHFIIFKLNHLLNFYQLTNWKNKYPNKQILFLPLEVKKRIKQN